MKHANNLKILQAKFDYLFQQHERLKTSEGSLQKRVVVLKKHLLLLMKSLDTIERRLKWKE